MEGKFTTGNVREAWQGLNAMMGREQRPAHIKCTDPTSFAEQLNTFYSRFDSVHPLRTETPSTLSPSHTSITVEKNKMVHFLSKVNPRKSSGPDNLHGRILKECASELGDVMTQFFQLLLDSGFVPRTWKESTIIPIPKITKAMAPKDYRPVALTSVLCKCMEWMICDLLTCSVADKLDPLQFAYKAKRGVEDACLTLLDTVTKNMDHTHSCSGFYSWIFPQLLIQSTRTPYLTASRNYRSTQHWLNGLEIFYRTDHSM